MPTGARIARAVAFRMQDEAHPSHNDQPSREVWAEGDGDGVMEVLRRFAEAPIRCNLLLELENAQEINIYPTLKASAAPTAKDTSAQEETGSIWDIALTLWPPAANAIRTHPASDGGLHG